MTRLAELADPLLNQRVAAPWIVFRLFHLLNEISDCAAAHLFRHDLSLSPQHVRLKNSGNIPHSKSPQAILELDRPVYISNRRNSTHHLVE